MAREIKFRIWDGDQIVYPIKDSELAFVDGSIPKFNVWSQGGEHLYEVIVKELMQFTGLLDKNGKEIYEGDILHNTEHGHKFIIQWGISGESYAGWAGNWLGKDFISPLFNSPLENCEVIGNIYVNPDLLK